jgi:hypothetical protein
LVSVRDLFAPAWTAAGAAVRVPHVGMIEVRPAALKAIACWAVEGEGFARVTLYDEPTGYVSGLEHGDVLATQGDAHIHVGADGLVKDAVPDDLVLWWDATG